MAGHSGGTERSTRGRERDGEAEAGGARRQVQAEAGFRRGARPPVSAPGRVCSCPSVPSDGLGFLPLLVDAAAPMAVTSPWLYSLFLLISLLPRY